MLDALLSRIPAAYNRYIEPFFGGGALFFALEPHDAIIADSNPDLITFYRVVAEDVEALIEAAANIPTDEQTYYSMRDTDTNTLVPLTQAARTLYLNHTCFNGLYRVNRQGHFNVPYGRYKNPAVCDPAVLRKASTVLRHSQIILGDYKEVLHTYAQAGDLIYLDPPYLPISRYSDFKRYTREQFYEDDHIELAAEIKRLVELGCYVLHTNANHPLVHKLYKGYSLQIHQTRRNIGRRAGEDVLVSAPPRPRLVAVPAPVILPSQVSLYPPTRFMGSKSDLLTHIWSVASQFSFDSVLDLFSGTGIVSYLFKAQGKQVISNDYMALCACFARALIQNNETRLTGDEIAWLCVPTKTDDGFVARTFHNLYFSDDDNQFIDTVRANLRRLGDQVKRDIAMAALVRACMKKRPRGIFTYTGERYDDGRRDLQLSLMAHFVEAAKAINTAVFDNGQANRARQGDALEVRTYANLVYIDPPYYSPLSDNEYVRRYHFVEGLARDWKDVQIQQNTVTKKFRSYPTPFTSRESAFMALDTIFKKHRQSILLVSYSSNSQPTKEEIVALMARYKRLVEVVSVDHRYSFGNQGHAIDTVKNQVEEFLFVGY